MGDSRTNVIEKFIRKPTLKTTTSANGTDWVQLGNANGSEPTTADRKCGTVKVSNLTATSLSFGFGAVTGTAPVGETYEIASYCGDFLPGLNDSREVFVRRTDTAASPVTFKSIPLV